MYAGAVAPVINDLLAGFNGTVFAYGQTGSGKTFTMMVEVEAWDFARSSAQRVRSCRAFQRTSSCAV